MPIPKKQCIVSPLLQVQLQLYSQVATEFSMHPLGTSGLDLREFVGVSQLLFILREYYGLTEEGAEVHAKVRPYLLLIVKNFVTKVSVSFTQTAYSRLTNSSGKNHCY